MRRPTVPDAVLAISATLLAASCLKNPLRMQDLGIYLAQAEWMGEHGGFGDVDHWTHTVDGVRYVNLTWLAQRAFLLVYRVSGFAGLQSLIALAAIATLVIVHLAARRVSARSGARAMAAPICALLIAQNLAMWPELFALPIFALYAALALTVKPKAWTIAVSAIAVALWANLHGSFPIAPVLSGLVAAGFALEAASAPRLAFADGGIAPPSSRVRAAVAALVDRERGGLHLVTAAVAFLATLANPWGIGAWTYVLFNAGNSHDWGISEWRATAITDSAGARLAIAWILFWFESRIARRNAHLRDLPALLAFTFLALYGLRYVCWIGMVLPIALARLFAPAEGPVPARAPDEREIPRGAFAALGAVLVALLVAASPQMRQRGAADEDARIAAIFHHDANVPLAKWAEEAGVRGNVYNPMEWGSWLTWRLGPEKGVRTFLDIRLWIFPDAVWRDYVHVLDAQAGWEEKLAARNVEWVFLSRELNAKLIPYLERSTGWERVYTDAHAVVYRRR